MSENVKWIITSNDVFFRDKKAYLGWQQPVWDDDGYFWTYKDVISDLIKENKNTPDHPFLFHSRGAAIRKLRKLDIPQKCKVVRWISQPAIKRVLLTDIRKEPYENWNYYNYENYNRCPCCNGKIRMLGSVSEYQRFVCYHCKREFVLNAITEEIEFIN